MIPQEAALVATSRESVLKNRQATQFCKARGRIYYFLGVRGEGVVKFALRDFEAISSDVARGLSATITQKVGKELPEHAVCSCSGSSF